MKVQTMLVRFGHLFLLLAVLSGLFLPVAATVSANDDVLPPLVFGPGAPQLLEPQKNLVTSDHTPIFRWEEELEATKYTLEIKNRVTNAVIAKSTYTAAARCSGGICSVPSPVSLPNGQYKWHVLSRTDDAKFEWSKWWNLDIGSISLDPPTLFQPADDAMVYYSQPTFGFTPVTGAIEYRFRLKNAAGIFIYDEVLPNTICFDSCSGDCYFELPIDLNSYETYQWQVQAKNGEYYSSWTRFFRLRYTQIGRTTLESPYDGQVIYVSNPWLQWERVDGAIYYQVTIRRESNDEVVYNGLVPLGQCGTYSCNWQYTGPALSIATYKWHVRGLNGENLSLWTPYWVFHRASTP